MNDWLKKTVVLILIVAFIAPAAVLLVPQKTEAQGGACIGTLLTGVISLVIGTVATFLTIPVGDMVNKATHDINSTFSGGTFISDCIIKPMVKALVKQLIHQFLMSIVDWINDGFDGSGPRFVSDPASFFADIADRAIGQVVMGSDLNFLCSPFALDVRLALGLNYWSGGFRDRITCTLSDIINNTMNAAERTAYRNSWQSWLDLTTQPQNNPYGAYALAKSQIEIRIANQQFVAGKEADWGTGFLTTKRCVEYITGEEELAMLDAYGGDPCLRYETVTPGKMIQEGISGTLQAEVSEYVAAEDLDAIFGALTNQMIGGIFKATGLFSGGRSNPNYYRNQFRDRIASGYYNPSGLPASMVTAGASCNNIQNYILITRGNQQIVQFYNQVITSQHPQPTWDDTSIPVADYEQAQNYCAQNPSWNAAQGAIDNITNQIEQGRNQQSQNACSQQSKLYSNDILSTNSSSFSRHQESSGGGSDNTVDGSTTTYLHTNTIPAWLEIILKKQETLSSIQIQTYDNYDSLRAKSTVSLYAADNSLISTKSPTSNTANYIINLSPPAKIQKIRIDQSIRLWVSEVTFNRYISPVVNWSGVSSAKINEPFNVLNGVTATKCTDDSVIPNSSGVSFTINPSSYTLNVNEVTFTAAGTYTVTYTANDGVASASFTRTIVVN